MSENKPGVHLCSTPLRRLIQGNHIFNAVLAMRVSGSFTSRLHRILKFSFHDNHKRGVVTKILSESPESIHKDLLDQPISISVDSDDRFPSVVVDPPSPIVNDVGVQRHAFHQVVVTQLVVEGDSFTRVSTAAESFIRTPGYQRALCNGPRNGLPHCTKGEKFPPGMLPLMLIADDPLEAKYLCFKARSRQNQSLILNEGVINDGSYIELDKEQHSVTPSSELRSTEQLKAHISERPQEQHHAVYSNNTKVADRRVRMTAGGQLILRHQIINKPSSRHYHQYGNDS